MHGGITTLTDVAFEAALAALDGGVPDAATYQRLSTAALKTRAIEPLLALDPFSAAYRDAVLALYASLRAGPDDVYLPERDEAPAGPVPADIWSQLSPWAFRDPMFVGEHLYAWGHIMRHLALPPGGSVLEYGPGSGQMLLMLARMGFRAAGVDVDVVALEGIRRQADVMGLAVRTERGLFGDGFGDERFDGIVFYEAFHHALDFIPLLHRLHDRLTPQGRLILCGEPIVAEAFPGIPYAWGPRLDALSVFCMRRFGWMELGFRQDFFVAAASRAGWHASHHPFPGCGRAQVYLLQPLARAHDVPPLPESPIQADLHVAHLEHEAAVRAMESLELAAIKASTSWRITAPWRAAGRLLGRR